MHSRLERLVIYFQEHHGHTKKERLANIKASQQAQKKKCHICYPWSKHFELHNDDSRQDRLYNKDISRVFSHVPSMPRKQVKKL